MFLRGTGRFTLDCAYDAQYTHPNLKGVGVSYVFENWSGRFTSICIGGHYSADNPVLAFQGDCSGARILFVGNTGDAGTPVPVAPVGVQMTDLNRRAGPSYQPNPDVSADAIRNLLADARTARFQSLVPTPADATDLRFSRVWIWRGRVGLHLKGAP
jgi:hypothetical protein